MAEAQDVEALKRRGRRRLVGAVALVLAAVIILPMVFDPEPRPISSGVSVRIPGEGEAPFAPEPPPQVQDATPAKPAPAPKVPPKPAAVEYVFQVGVYANPENVTTKLKTAKVPYFTESAKGKLTRVRAGPFATKEAADRAHAQMKKLGLAPGAVTRRPG